MSGRAITDSRVLRFPVTHFPQLIQKMPDLTQRLVGLMSDRIREATRVEQQRDRLAGLGKLSAGLAHELNNPASAAKRATSQLRATMKRIKDASHALGAHDLTAAQRAEIEKLEASLVQQDGPPPDTLTISTWKKRSIPGCAVTGKMTCGSWRQTWRTKIFSLPRWTVYMPLLTPIQPAPPW